LPHCFSPNHSPENGDGFVRLLLSGQGTEVSRHITVSIDFVIAAVSPNDSSFPPDAEVNFPFLGNFQKVARGLFSRRDASSTHSASHSHPNKLMA